jgi:hypothetical protein
MQEISRTCSSCGSVGWLAAKGFRGFRLSHMPVHTANVWQWFLVTIPLCVVVIEQCQQTTAYRKDVRGKLAAESHRTWHCQQVLGIHCVQQAGSQPVDRY